MNPFVWLLVIELNGNGSASSALSPIVVDNLPTSTECVRLADSIKAKLRGVVAQHCFPHQRGAEQPKPPAPVKLLT